MFIFHIFVFRQTVKTITNGCKVSDNFSYKCVYDANQPADLVAALAKDIDIYKHRQNYAEFFEIANPDCTLKHNLFNFPDARSGERVYCVFFYLVFDLVSQGFQKIESGAEAKINHLYKRRSGEIQRLKATT